MILVKIRIILINKRVKKVQRMKKILSLIVLLLFMCLLTGCGNNLDNNLDDLNEYLEDASYVYPDSKNVIVTLNEFNQLKSGMTPQEVWNIIGGQCTNTGTTDMGIGEEYITVSYGCNGNGSVGANVLLMFQGGKLTTFSQYGLE